jgi:hypothetical protein
MVWPAAGSFDWILFLCQSNWDIHQLLGCAEKLGIFSQWGYVKAVCQTLVVDIKDLKNRSEAAFASVKTDILQVEPEVSVGRCMLISCVHVEGV